jgi:hypothetical protein
MTGVGFLGSLQVEPCAESVSALHGHLLGSCGRPHATPRRVNPMVTVSTMNLLFRHLKKARI